MNDMVDLIAGAWREGLDATSRTAIEWFEQRRAAGFRLIGAEIEQAKLIDLLDSYDTLVGELMEDWSSAVPEPTVVSGDDDETWIPFVLSEDPLEECVATAILPPVTGRGSTSHMAEEDEENEKWEEFLLDQADFHEYEMRADHPPEPIKPPRVGKAKSRIKQT